MKLFFILTVFYFLACVSLAQPSSVMEPVKIGEQVPDFQLSKLINYPSATAKRSDFKGKWLILDFWSTGCMGCIQSFPKLLELQQKFKDQVAIVLVNSFQDEATVRAVYERQKKLRNITMTLPSVCGDSSLRKFFPHESVPHTVWIDDKGILQYITYSESLTEKNIQAVLNKQHVYMKPKGESKSWSITQPLFTPTNGGLPKDTLWQSSLFKGLEGVNADYGIVSNAETNLYKVVAINQCIRDLYRLAYSRTLTSWGAIEPVLLSNIELHVSDSASLVANYFDIRSEEEWSRLYTYSLSGPSQSKESLQRVMQKDLDRYFDLDAKWERKEKMCLVLTAADTNKISYRSGATKRYFDSFKVDLNNVPVSYFIDHLVYGTRFIYSHAPLIDETGLKGNLGHIAFEADMNNLDVLNKNLSVYGMKFSFAKRMADVLVISDRKNQ